MDLLGVSQANRYQEREIGLLNHHQEFSNHEDQSSYVENRFMDLG